MKLFSSFFGMDSSRWISAAICLLISTTFPSVEAQVGSAPSFKSKPKNLTVGLHTTVVLECQAFGLPTPTLTWVKYTDSGKTVIRTSGRFVLTPWHRYLYILGVLWSDAGRYGCIAQNSHGRIVADAYLTVLTESAPTWHVKPHNVTLYKGQQYTLPCRTYGYPIPIHYWTKNGAAISIADPDVLAGKNDLYFYAANTRHSGLYTCSAYNRHGSVSHSVYVKVVSDPTIVIQPEKASTIRGAAITLSCGVVGSANSMSVKWTKNKNDLRDDTLISFVQQTWHNVQIYSLKIKKVRSRHLGIYNCIVTNTGGSVTSNGAEVSFTRSVTPLKIEVPKPMVITTEGSDVDLMCIFTGSPTPQVTWYKGGQKLSSGVGIQVIIALNNRCEAILKLSDVMQSVGGKFVCKGDSIAGSVEGNITLIVKGEGSTPDVSPANQLKEAQKDSNATLWFVVKATPVPDITWYKNGKQLESIGSTRRHSNGTYIAELAIISAQYSDGGFYTCIAQNLFGISSGNATLTVKGRPEVPTNVTVKRTALTTVLVSWVPGYNGGADCTFTVQFKKSDSNTWTSAAAVGANATRTELSNSKSWDGLFVFRVTAVNEFGSSESSEVSVTLKGENTSRQQHTDNKTTGAIVGGVIGGVLFIVLIIIVVLVLCRLKKNKKSPPKPLPAVMYAVVDEENNTYDTTYTDARGTPQERCDTYSYVSIRPDAATAMAAGAGGEYASIHRPKQWEVPKRNVRLDKILGSGHFGKVMKGFLKTKQGTQVVAVKMLKENADQQQKKEFLAELELMKTMAPHPNIVGLVGCCSKSGQPFIIVEYCSMGNLRDFLRSSHGSVVYANMAGNSLTLTNRDLLSFAWQCARGMSYLASLKLVHRDLAARNILVDKGHVCKIADFGLARDIYEQKQYLKLGEAELPLRWMATESIFQGVTTTKSDVWSYGVLLWEIVTLGANPYPGMSRDDFIEQLRAGYRMPKPPFCSDELYSIMWQCWQQDPESRPTFLELGKTLHRLMTAQTLSIDLDNYDRSYINATEEQE